jgi:serine/threonine-protein kinase HipA
MTEAGEVSFNGVLAGCLYQPAPNQFIFFYLKSYLRLPDAKPIAFLLPLHPTPFQSPRLFTFFEGLVAEGWLKQKQSTLQKIDENDSFSLLINNGEDLIGAVTVRKISLERVYELQNLP